MKSDERQFSSITVVVFDIDKNSKQLEKILGYLYDHMFKTQHAVNVIFSSVPLSGVVICNLSNVNLSV